MGRDIYNGCKSCDLLVGQLVVKLVEEHGDGINLVLFTGHAAAAVACHHTIVRVNRRHTAPTTCSHHTGDNLKFTPLLFYGLILWSIYVVLGLS